MAAGEATAHNDDDPGNDGGQRQQHLVDFPAERTIRSGRLGSLVQQPLHPPILQPQSHPGPAGSRPQLLSA